MNLKAKDKLTPEERREAAQLKRIFLDRQAQYHFGHEAFSEEYGLSSAQAVSHYLNGVMALNLKAAAQFARGLRCDISDFSPRLAAEVASIGLTQLPVFSSRIQSLPPNEQRLLDFYRILGKDGKKLLQLWADHYLSKSAGDATPESGAFFDSMQTTPLPPEGSEAPKTVRSTSTIPAKSSEGMTKATSTGASRDVQVSNKRKRR